VAQGGAERQGGGAQRATLKEIANAVGVSRSTVSLVLRDSPQVARATRERVQAAMAAAGYLYNRGAARLRTGVSHTAGLIVSEITNPFYAELTAGIDAALDRAGWLAFLANSGDQPERQERFIRRIREQGADGIILGPAEGTPRDLPEQLRRQNFPCVQILRHVGEAASDYVGPDYVLGMTLAVEHLVGLGHRRIAYLRSPRQTSATRERLAGLTATLARHGLPAAPVVPCGHSRAQAAAAVEALLQRPDPPTALVCHNDVMALGALAGLSRLRVRPGGDVAVIGFDNIAEAATSVPPLSTVATRPAEVGAEAAELLLRRIADRGGPPERIVLPPRLVVRET
jgi:LacI family transcriptional regulator